MADKTKRFIEYGFALRFKELLKETNEQELSEYLGVSKSAFRQWLNGYTLPTCENLYKLKAHFGVMTDYLLGLSDYRTLENTITAVQLPYSDNAIDFLRECQPVMREMVSNLLGDVITFDFFTALMSYVYGSTDDKKNEHLKSLAKNLELVTNTPVTQNDVALLLNNQRWSSVIDILRNMTDLWIKTRLGGSDDNE